MRFIPVLAAIMSLIPQVKGQESDTTRFIFQGKVVDAATFQPLPGSQIFINRQFSSASDDDGEFSVFVRVADTVVFSMLGYKSQSLAVSDTLLKGGTIAGIFMTGDTLSIGEVVIIPRLSNLRYEIMNTPSRLTPEMENARQNVAVSAYQGRTTTGQLGNPDSNYEFLRQQQRTRAYERGGIPSDRIVGLSPFMLLINGLPTKPAPMKPRISDQELDEMINRYQKKNLK